MSKQDWIDSDVSSFVKLYFIILIYLYLYIGSLNSFLSCGLIDIGNANGMGIYDSFNYEIVGVHLFINGS